ncbi:hypothetical protein [Paraburkholderia aromaticivorans]|uniref:hypothetical protein n=1 Tax=Paraburkholderia aromaticivorans TaxID=2026199 RepID=UPI001455E337|nr:hypothetical protein [Paraburkholderia aromaticivorans]
MTIVDKIPAAIHGGEHSAFSRVKLAAIVTTLAILAGCSTTYTVDDGRKVDDTLLAQIRTYGEGTRALRPAIVKSAELHDKNCSTQWELPFAFGTSDGQSAEAKIAWVRGMGVDEHLRITATSPGLAAAPGDIVAELNGYRSNNARKMVARLADLTNKGAPFDMTLDSGVVVNVTPLRICRGRVSFAIPGKYANAHVYHWEASAHPEEIARIGLTPAEAEWVVLWTQGLSEQGGTRMKSYSYSIFAAKAIVNQAISVATFGVGPSVATASTSAVAVTGAAVRSAATQMVEERAAKTAAQATVAAAASKAKLWGLDWAASTAFDEADRWAFERMALLGMDPRTGLELQTRLAQAGAVNNALLFDDARLQQMNALIAAMPNAAYSGTIASNVQAPSIELRQNREAQNRQDGPDNAPSGTSP